jgi:hypothetical protein
MCRPSLVHPKPIRQLRMSLDTGAAWHVSRHGRNSASLAQALAASSGPMRSSPATTSGPAGKPQLAAERAGTATGRLASVRDLPAFSTVREQPGD